VAENIPWWASRFGAGCHSAEASWELAQVNY